MTRVVTTIAELDALPAGACVRRDYSDAKPVIAQRLFCGGWTTTGAAVNFDTEGLAKHLPLTVTSEPEGSS